MSDRTSSPLVLSDALVPRAAVRAWLAVSGGMGALATGLMLMLSVAANSGGEAERITETQDDAYLTTLVSALAVNFAKPLR
ncbi:hypothetical protein [Methylobacterium aerolatum]|uniref:Uncharacterized protein n=1 Tax=Methylobacterium aerolatum TaxID=418708 RepID=A0ABU0HU74_9HYPH|nr:hypothetical protein [Methylobacterium aerolatum]MDQ0445883.1 hypothetical protein [Methylobacterium aerolatum]GJD35857.1 hypothetical protein FMGBMHLM_2770 [Methylobacterium aerolatum]